ncbi:Serine proteinase stubble-like protein [Leptotrombidium deliense]|uniref:limulus clotting factor C n=1 Tax=Leptotrombidium deliense TaxID=299467 RepID=A0A443RXW9_9ACAR|nr:Serine proteinase stubble-like protein [Leptotrombidium deliense]
MKKFNFKPKMKLLDVHVSLYTTKKINLSAFLCLCKYYSKKNSDEFNFLALSIIGCTFSNVSEAKKECGMSSKTGGRIVGGREAYVGEYPWQVALLRKGLRGDEYFCGGSILNQRWIITAAHCVADEQAADIKVAVGTHDVTKISAKDTFLVDKIIKHKNFTEESSGVLRNDIALLRLKSSINILSSDAINTVCLPKQDQGFVKNMEVSGWGRTDEQSLESKVLRTVQVAVQANKECYRSMKGRFYAREMFCAGVRVGGKDSCQGDSGGPIVKRIKRNGGKAYLAGIVSFGIGCGRSGQYGIYTRIPTYITWIRKQIE